MVNLRPTRKGALVADRTILKYTEDRLPEGPYWTLNIERSASGKPDVLVTIRHESFDGTLEPREMTVVVKDADLVFDNVVWWAKQRRAENY
jgi:hypothetical protein